jgi:ketosteroid isomerase-like protein
MNDNVTQVQEIFAAFGRGDIEFILNQLSDDIQWRAIGTPEVPHAGAFTGKNGAVQFFTALGGAFEFETFEPQEFLAAENAIIVLGTEKVRARATGVTAVNDWAMVFHFADGKITRFTVYENSATLANALRQTF